MTGRAAGWLTAAALLASVAGAAVPARAAGGVHVLQGTAYRQAIFPNDALTVADPTQLTGKRVNFRVGVDYPACDATNYSICDGYTLLNTLDGFDLMPRVVVPFSGAIDVASVNANDFFIQGPGGRTALLQLVWDPASNTLSGISNAFLQEDSQYDIVVTSAIKDPAGNAIDACGGACVVAFTTRSATPELENIRRTLDSGAAYTAAGISNRKLTFTQNGVDDVFTAQSVMPSVANPLNGMQRLDQKTTTNPASLSSSAIPNLIPPTEAGWFAFGSFPSPRYQYRSATFQQDDAGGLTDAQIPPVPSTATPQPFGADRLGAILILPVGTPPSGGWPVAIYGPGFTRSKFDIFVSADHNAAAGIATIATDPAGHAFGPNSAIKVTTATGTTQFLGYGRGHDLDGDGFIGDGLSDGVEPTDHKTVDKPGDPTQKVLADVASHKMVDGLRSGLIQTVVDQMALARSIKAGVDVPGVGTDVLSHTDISYYGLSFGGIYGTMLMGTDPTFQRGLLNSLGAPIVDIARLSGFRGDLSASLKVTKPDLLNGGPGLNGFTESLLLRGDPPVTSPLPGAVLLQETFASVNWYDRAGSPESFAPYLRLRPRADVPPKPLLFQSAYADDTVPNPTAGNIYRAGQLFDLVTYYRNDRTPTYNSDPHGFLADPTLAGRTDAEAQMTAFLKTGTAINPNPAWFEVPVAEPSNFSCLHYAEPETGTAWAGPMDPLPGTGDCPHLAADDNGGWLAAVSIPQVTAQGQQLLQGTPNTAAGRVGLLPLVLLGLGLAALLARRRPQARV